MARKKGFFQSLAQIQRETERQRLAAVRTHNQAVNTAIRTQAAYQRAYFQAEKAQQQATAAEQKRQAELYLQSRIAQVEWQNAQIEQTFDQLKNILSETLAVDDYLDLDTLKQFPQVPPFNPGNLAIALPPPYLQNYLPPEPSGVQKMMPGVKQKHTQEVAFAQQRFNADYAAYSAAEAKRKATLDTTYSQYLRHYAEIREKAEAQNAEIDKFEEELSRGVPEAILSYCNLVLESSVYPENFPQQARLAYVPESKQLVVEYVLPTFEVVPTVSSYKYVKTKDKITEMPRPAVPRKEIYTSVVAQVTLRTVHELFEADRLNHIETLVFNGMVETVDKGTGRDISVCVVTLRTTRDTFLQLNLSKVDPIVCLKSLNAGVSRSPAELAPVRPVLEFNMVDRRFVQETDIISGLDQRPNLMDLTPSEFESLITNLFQKMGLEAKLTQASRDGGVDCVAYDPRPVLGGKVVIQAKRYKHTVGVSAVRDLYGTVHNEGASKGILVTTSGYGKDAYNFANGKPLELLDGSNLLYLLQEHAGIEAKIIIPEE